MIIDVSGYNTITDWAKVAESVDGIIIRVGYRGYGSGKLVTDNKFHEYMTNAKKYNIPASVYFVTQAITEAEAIEEAEYTVNLIKDYVVAFPIFIDSENGEPSGKGRADRYKLTKDERTKILKAFCDKVKSLGYASGIYASESWFKEELHYIDLLNYWFWVAKHSVVSPAMAFDLWQYTSSGTVNGISGRVDISNITGTVSSTYDGDFPTLPNRGYYRYGDGFATYKTLKTQIKKIQKFLNWAIGSNLTIDGAYGYNTMNAVKNFQAITGLTADGYWGNDTQAKAKAYTS